jgi:Uma2 family endonuclease
MERIAQEDDVVIAETQTSSLEDFLALPDDGNRHEFVRGEVRSMPPHKGVHSKIEAILHELLGRYPDDRACELGWRPEDGFSARDRLVGFTACGEFGLEFSVPDDPHQIRGADIAYIPPEQYAAVPALLIEVISPSEKAADVTEKVQDYLAGGARRVWCVYPQRRRVYVESADGPTCLFRHGDTLTDEDLLPGFSLLLPWIF